MGIYRSIDITRGDEIVAFPHMNDIEELAGYDRDGLWHEEAAWHDQDDDMRAYSKKFPDLLFEIWCEGDDSKWIDYYKDGKMLTCGSFLTYDPFDESKMK